MNALSVYGQGKSSLPDYVGPCAEKEGEDEKIYHNFLGFGPDIAEF